MLALLVSVVAASNAKPALKPAVVTAAKALTALARADNASLNATLKNVSALGLNASLERDYASLERANAAPSKQPVSAQSAAISLVAQSPPSAKAMQGYKSFLARTVAFKRWRMGIFYIWSTGMAAWAAAMPPGGDENAAKYKDYLTKASAFFDILANYEIVGFIYCVLLLTWAGKPPATPAEAFVFGQGLKVVNAFWTWQWWLLLKDYMTLFPAWFAKADPKWAGLVNFMQVHTCFYAFNEWHVAKMMGAVSLTDPKSPSTQAKLGSLWSDEMFIATVKTLVANQLWSWYLPEQKWLPKVGAAVALGLPWIAGVEAWFEVAVQNADDAAAATATPTGKEASKAQ
jgi:hypothetical protein